MNMQDKICLVTGASAGIGKEIALGLAKLGARVVIVCRNASRGWESIEDIRSKSGNHSLELMLADLSSQRQIRKLAEKYKTKYDKLHVLVNNAGVIMGRRCLTEDGMEMTFAVNYLAYFLLTNLLLDVIKSSAPSRIVNMASMAHRTVGLDFDNLQGEKVYNRDVSYAQSKLADIMFTYEMARRLEGTGVTVNCVCPGGVATDLWERSSKFIDGFFKLFMKGPGEGARLPLYLASSDQLDKVSCSYFQTKQHLKFSKVNVKRTEAKSAIITYDKDVAGKLWQISEKLTGLSRRPEADSSNFDKH